MIISNIKGYSLQQTLSRYLRKHFYTGMSLHWWPMRYVYVAKYAQSLGVDLDRLWYQQWSSVASTRCGSAASKVPHSFCNSPYTKCSWSKAQPNRCQSTIWRSRKCRWLDKDVKKHIIVRTKVCIIEGRTSAIQKRRYLGSNQELVIDNLYGDTWRLHTDFITKRNGNACRKWIES